MDTIIIGIDGGEWDVIDPLIADGSLPNLASLREKGIAGDLASTTPPVSPPAWSSIHTGKNPGKHGIYDFNYYDEKYRQQTINATHRQAPPFWKIMNDGGVSTGLFKIPFTYPPESVDGFAVTGFPTPSSVEDFAEPASIRDLLPEPAALFEDWSYIKEGSYERFAENLFEVAERQTNLFLDLLDERDTDFGMTVYDGSDRIQHFYWKFFDEDHSRYERDEFFSSVIPRYYEIVDRAIGEIRDATGEDTDVIVLSDHGFGSLEKDVRIDEWLADHGYLSRYGSESSGGARVKLLSKGVDLVWSTVERLGIADEVKSVLPKEVVLSGGQLRNKTDRSINWEASKAFFTNLSGQAILINLEGRYASGSVSDDEYEAVITSLQEELCGLRDPSTDERIVLDVHHKSDIYEGDAIDDAPDLVVETHPRYTLTEGSSENLVELSRQYGQDRSGDHRTDGIFIGAGPSFASGALESGSILDIAPTLLHLHGLAVPATMDGDVLTDALNVDREVTQTSEYEDAESRNRDWTDEEQDELTERLKNMGYIN